MKRYTVSIWGNKYNQLINNGCCLVSIVAAVLLVGCWESQQSVSSVEVKPVEPVVEVPAQQSSPQVELKPVELIGEVPAQNVKPANPKADRALIDAVQNGNIEAAMQAIADGADVDTLDKRGRSPIQNALHSYNIEAVKLLIDNGANINAKDQMGGTPLDQVQNEEIIDYLRIYGGKTGEELKAEGK